MLARHFFFFYICGPKGTFTFRTDYNTEEPYFQVYMIYRLVL